MYIKGASLPFQKQQTTVELFESGIERKISNMYVSSGQKYCCWLCSLLIGHLLEWMNRSTIAFSCSHLLELIIQQCSINTGIVCDDNVFRFEIGVNVGDTINLFEDTGHRSLTSPAAFAKIMIGEAKCCGWEFVSTIGPKARQMQQQRCHDRSCQLYREIPIGVSVLLVFLSTTRTMSFQQRT